MSRKKPVDQMSLKIESRSVNESFARVAVSAFAAQQDPTVEEISDIKTAVSEAVTNCIVHAYPASVGEIYIWVGLFDDGLVRIRIRDRGCGIIDVRQAMEPLFTTLGGERAWDSPSWRALWTKCACAPSRARGRASPWINL